MRKTLYINYNKPRIKTKQKNPQKPKIQKKIAYKKNGKRKSNYKNFMILLCHRFDNKGKRRKHGNLKKKKKKPKSRATHNHKILENKNNKT